ncbi:hypothetical protein NFI96_000187 [Prochilodus magdalenae]|nr:hypothetical protein NFI96_000187 [Prochilodus magdalenae]
MIQVSRSDPSLYLTDPAATTEEIDCPQHHVTVTKHCSGVVPDCHGVTQKGSGSSSVTSPALVLVETPNEPVCGGTVSSTGNFSQRLWLGVAASCVSLYRQGEAEALECLPIAQICSYGVSDSNTFRITAGDRDLLFETSKLTEIMQLMNAYFSATRRQLGKDDCITMETTPKLRPSLLELPSHPV